MADIKTITKPSKDADHPVDVIQVVQAAKRKRGVAEDSDDEGNFCC